MISRQSRESHSYLAGDSTTISVFAHDAQSGIQRVEFLWHSGDWVNDEWVWLGADTNGSDSWSLDLLHSQLPNFTNGAFYVWAFDWGDNWAGAGLWNIGLDTIAPTATIEVTPLYGGNTSRRFFVNWDSNNETAGTVSFDVEYRTEPFGLWQMLTLNTSDYFTSVVGLPGTLYWLRVKAKDAAGNTSPYASSPAINTSVCTASQDSYESDDTNFTAQLYSAGEVLYARNFHQEHDEDWVRFEARVGITYTIQTTNEGGGADTVLTLLSPDASTMIATNDDIAEGDLSSKIIWQASANGTYFVMVRHFDDYAYGCKTGYSLVISEQSNLTLEMNVYLPSLLRQ